MRIEKWAPALAAAAVMLAVTAAPAAATEVYSAGPVTGTLGAFNMGGPFTIAQKFTFADATTFDTVEFGLWVETGGTVTAIEWAILDKAPSAGGAVVKSGVANSFSTTLVRGSNADFCCTEVSLAGFGIGSTSLAAGDWYLRLHAVTPDAFAGWDIVDHNIEAGEQVWEGWPEYRQNTPLAAFTLSNNGTSGAVPEPGAWALMIAGFGLAGAGLRRSKRAIAA